MNIEKAVDEIMDEIHECAAPENMTQAEAADFYEEIASNCSASARALRQEMG